MSASFDARPGLEPSYRSGIPSAPEAVGPRFAGVRHVPASCQGERRTPARRDREPVRWSCLPVPDDGRLLARLPDLHQPGCRIPGGAPTRGVRHGGCIRRQVWQPLGPHRTARSLSSRRSRHRRRPPGCIRRPGTEPLRRWTPTRLPGPLEPAEARRTARLSLAESACLVVSGTHTNPEGIARPRQGDLSRLQPIPGRVESRRWSARLARMARDLEVQCLVPAAPHRGRESPP